MVCARMRKQSACVARSFKVSSLSYEDSNTVVASGVAGIVCSAESVGLREGFKEEGEKRLFWNSPKLSSRCICAKERLQELVADKNVHREDRNELKMVKGGQKR